MASGFKSCHPLTVEALKALKVKSSQVTQGYGSAPASAGFHAPVGKAEGKPYSTCVDLAAELINQEFFHTMNRVGFVTYVRNAKTGWMGSAHIHAIHLGLVNDNGDHAILSGPRAQVVDFLKQPPLNGLVGHDRLRGYVPTAMEQAELRVQYSNWQADYPTRVIAPEGHQIPCYAWLENGSVCCEVAPFMTYWGCFVRGTAKTLTVYYEDKVLDLQDANLTFNGYHWRGQVRQLAQKVDLDCSTEQIGCARKVQLLY